MNTKIYKKAEIIYLDVDGVLLANDKQPAKHVTEFLRFLVEAYEVQWLTTHVHYGDTTWVNEFLGGLLDNEAKQLIKRIQPTAVDWKESKTEAIDKSRPFLWVDDDLYPGERQALQAMECLENWIGVDLSKDEDQLANLINNLPRARFELSMEIQNHD